MCGSLPARPHSGRKAHITCFCVLTSLRLFHLSLVILSWFNKMWSFRGILNPFCSRKIKPLFKNGEMTCKKTDSGHTGPREEAPHHLSQGNASAWDPRHCTRFPHSAQSKHSPHSRKASCIGEHRRSWALCVVPVGLESGLLTVGTSLAFCQKLITTMRPSNSTPEYITKGLEIRGSSKPLHTNVHCSAVHRSQKVRPVKCPSRN